MKIMLADDERELLNALTTALQKENHEVVPVLNGGEAYARGLYGDFDLIILDIMMPLMSGLEVLSKLRKEGISTPIMILTAKTEVGDRVAGLDAGADDYLPKPFATSEFLARVRALLRRKGYYAAPTLTFCGVTLEESTFELSYGGQRIRLSSREFQIMKLFMETPRRIVPTTHFIERIWGWDSDIDVSIVWVNVSNIRKKLADISAPVSIRATRGVGYTLEASQ